MSEDVNIEDAKKGDLNYILSLIKEYELYDIQFAKRYYDIYFAKNKLTAKDKVFVAKIDEQIVGIIGLCRDYFSTDYSYWLGWFVVGENFRGKKNLSIAEKLLKRVERELKKRRIEKLFVSTDDKNSRAKSFYIKHKFRSEGVLRDYYYKNEDQLILSKSFYYIRK
jgi:ribosomal protein S18 acetylase RimI-like enzyme